MNLARDHAAESSVVDSGHGCSGLHDLAHIQIEPGQFADLFRLCGWESRFPPSEQAWQAMQLRAREELLALGLHRHTLELNTQAFEKWCAQVGVAPCLDALRAHAIVRRTPLRSGQTNKLSRAAWLDLSWSS